MKIRAGERYTGGEKPSAGFPYIFQLPVHCPLVDWKYVLVKNDK
jgi:hypothetical protein